jgi:hypothetical protein
MTSQASTQPHLALNTTQRIRAHLSLILDDGIHKHTHSLTQSSTIPMTFHPSLRKPSHHITPPRVITIQNLGTNLKPIERKSVDRFFPYTAYLPSTFRIRPPPTIPSETPSAFHSKTSGTHTRYPPHHPKQSKKGGTTARDNSPTRKGANMHNPSRSRLPISSPPSSRPPARTHIATKTHMSRLKPRDRQAAQRDESCTKNC